MAENNGPPIIIIKKVSGHGGHHGGAWKVAYADFVTAMMALFIVLWLMNSSEQVKKAVSGYFNDPDGRGKQTGSGMAGTGESLALASDDMAKLKEKIEDAMKKMPEFEKIKDQVEMTVTGEGLRIELLETEKGMFFESGNSQPSGEGKELINKLAAELGKLNNKVLLEGHTDSRQFANDKGYSNWELSADRANAARRLMQGSGLRSDQITQVRGFADQRLRKSDVPDDPSNRRISVIVQYQTPPPAEEDEKEGKKGEGGHGGEPKKAEGGHGEAKKAEGGHGEEKPKAEAHAEQKPSPAHK